MDLCLPVIVVVLMKVLGQAMERVLGMVFDD